jgi:hypothetical protein
MAVVMLAVMLVAAMPASTASAETIGYFKPSTVTISGRSAWLTPTNVFNSDSVYASTAAKKKQLKLGDFNISPIQGNSTIQGIEVSVKGYQTAGRQAKVELSWDGGKTWASYKPQTNLGASDSTVILGDSTNVWGRTWAASEFTNARFKVKLTSTTGTGTLYIDHVLVKIYYSPTDTTLVVQKAEADYGAPTVTLSATLTQTVGGAALAGRSINFTLNGLPAGSAVTDESGIATLTTSIAGLNAGLYQDAVFAEFLGEPTLQATYGIADLDIHGELVIVQPLAQYKTYGSVDPILTFSVISGPLTAADLTGALAREAGEDVNDYLISKGTLSAPLGYVLQVLENEFLTITPAMLTVTTLDYEKATYAPAITSFAPFYSGFVFNEDAGVIDTPATCTVDAALQAVEGTYPIVCAGALDLNYEFTYAGGTLTVIKPAVKRVSVAAHDGWVRESSENSNRGSALNTASGALRVGDDAGNRQYRSIVSFKGITLPLDAMITKVTLQLVGKGSIGTNPFTTHGNLKVDLRVPVFGNPGLQITDFQTPPSLGSVAVVRRYNLSSNLYIAQLNPAAITLLNNWHHDPAHIYGLRKLQLRLRFLIDDNNDFGADFFKFHSGNSLVPDTQPVLIIEYTVP